MRGTEEKSISTTKGIDLLFLYLAAPLSFATPLSANMEVTQQSLTVMIQNFRSELVGFPGQHSVDFWVGVGREDDPQLND